MTTKKPTTFWRASAYGTLVCWDCQRALNNRGVMIVVRYGNQLWRTDTRQRTSAADLRADGWEKRR